MKTTTPPTKSKEILRKWYVVDVKDKVLGRAAVEIALKLMGKSKPYFVRNLDCGDHVVVINARYVAVTGKKEKDKLYTRYSGYPGGLKAKALWQVRQENPGEIVRHAVWGMLPKNKLRDRLITRLYVFAETDHPYSTKVSQSAAGK
ncbi:50S ribosomal protein L13 [Candidatus Gottesmanbacteria bacterium RBG_16_52_11]|uniref:Large ribosomal subunit protein uL13 n=1 Tax=Candidatus Gottesmanbacteria bacterium RBG_16_52_11 TaxID=1798374 RepID=A0A1F5YXV0_9BACT|nr:MAG: 50S ribosomal protein L13 [Candidatus Gottesmanbacteria bacterium RBG_16_52_11]